MKRQALLRDWTTSQRRCRPWRLQTRLICGCHHAQWYSPPRGWRSLQPDGLADRYGFHCGGPKPYVRFVDSASPWWVAEFCFCRSSHARPIHSPILCWSVWGQFHCCSLHRSSHTLGQKQKRGLGGWDDRWSKSCAKLIATILKHPENNSKRMIN